MGVVEDIASPLEKKSLLTGVQFEGEGKTIK